MVRNGFHVRLVKLNLEDCVEEVFIDADGSEDLPSVPKCIHDICFSYSSVLFVNIIILSSMFKLTLRGLSLFFKILPISNTGVSAAYILATVHFLYPKLGSFSDMEYYFYQLAYQDLKVPKRFVGLNQMQCSPSFDWNWGKQNDPTASWHQLHP